MKVTATTGTCFHLNVPIMASLTPHKEGANVCKDYIKRYNIIINVYAQHIIARHAVNKQHSLRMTIENNEPNNLRERNQHTRPSLCREQSAIALLIMYFTVFNIYTDVYIATSTFYTDMYIERPKTENSIYPYKNEHAIAMLMLLFKWSEVDLLVGKTSSHVIIRKKIINKQPC